MALLAYQHFADRDPLTRLVLDQMLIGRRNLRDVVQIDRLSPPRVGRRRASTIATVNGATAQETIDRAGRALVEAASSPARVILFGSRATGRADERSDFDFLVIEHSVEDRFGEMARLGRVLGQMLIPADVVVVSEQHVNKWASVRGSLVHEALSEGRIVAQS